MSLEESAIDVRTALLMLGCLFLAVSGWVYGLKFIKKHNHFLGYEYLIIGSSAANFLFYFATLEQASYDLMIYLDAFSRAFGFPILATMGLMVVTHNLKASTRTELAIFAVTLSLTAIMLSVDAMEPLLPYLYLGAMSFYFLYLAYVAKLLVGQEKRGAAIWVALAVLANAIIASIYDFYVIPGEETNIVFNFFFLALVTWAASLVIMYYAYLALEAGPKTEGP